jgi:peptidoglycan/LPS O-acetylase OafA/YrhL
MDSLRATAMFLGLVLHAGVVFAQWPIHPFRSHDEPSVFLHYIMEIVHVFRMELFFLVAGFFSVLLVQKRGLNYYVKNRAIRILFPFIICIVLLQPLQAAGYYLDVTGSNGSLLTQYITYLKKPGYILREPKLIGNWFWHFWFLQLLIYFIACFAIGSFIIGKLNKRLKLSSFLMNAVGGRFGVFILTFMTYTILIFSPPWADVPRLGTSIEVLLYYGLFFVFGALFFTHQKSLEQIQANVKYHIIPFLLALLILIPLIDELTLKTQPEILLQDWALFETEKARSELLGNFPFLQNPFNFSSVSASAEWHLMCLLRAYTTWCAILFLILIFKKFLSKQTALGRYFADSSYFIYLLHFPIQLSFSYYLRDRVESALLCFSICLIGSVAICLLLYHLTCRGTVIGTLLSGRRYSLNLANEFNEIKKLMRRKAICGSLVGIAILFVIIDRVESRDEQKLLYYSLHAEPGNIENYITLNSGKDLSEITRWDGRNSLHLASSNMTKPRPDEVISRSIQLLLNNGFNPNSVDNFGLTPLHYAVKNNNKTAIKLLLRAGAKSNAAESSYGNSPLHYAATLGNEDFIQNLIAAGGDPKLPRKNGENSLDIFKKFHSKPFPAK